MPTDAYTSAYDLLRELLKESRESEGVSQAALAKKLNVPQSYVSKYETGERRLDFVETAEICEALGIKTAEFANLFELRLGKARTASQARDSRRRKS